ncbi:MAG: hypothetical protein MI784_17800, partial [Cytophagales bacterium]|nr:hypothetical protein [Cytophagales bacterium]
MLRKPSHVPATAYNLDYVFPRRNNRSGRKVNSYEISLMLFSPRRRSPAKPNVTKSGISKQPPIQCYHLERHSGKEYKVSDNRDLAIPLEEKPRCFYGSERIIQELKDWFVNLRNTLEAVETNEYLELEGQRLKKIFIALKKTDDLKGALNSCSRVGSVVGGTHKVNQIELVFRDEKSSSEHIMDGRDAIRPRSEELYLGREFCDVSTRTTYHINRLNITDSESVPLILSPRKAYWIKSYPDEKRHFESMLNETDLVKTQVFYLGINQFAQPEVGESYLQYAASEFVKNIPLPSGGIDSIEDFFKLRNYDRGAGLNAEPPCKFVWRLHWATVLAVSGNDRLTFEYFEPYTNMRAHLIEAFQRLYLQNDDFRKISERLFTELFPKEKRTIPLIVKQEYFRQIAEKARKSPALTRETRRAIDQILEVDLDDFLDDSDLPGFFNMYGEADQSFFHKHSPSCFSPFWQFVSYHKVVRIRFFYFVT